MQTCRYCAREIPARVTVCPCCRSVLPGAAFFQRHAALATLGGMLAICLSVSVTLVIGLHGLSAHLFNRPVPQPASVPPVVVTSRFGFSQRDDQPLVIVLGTLRNTGNRTLRAPLVQVEFFDQAGRLSDAGEQSERAAVIPPGATVAFKVTRRREFDFVQYASHRVWVRGTMRDY